LFAEDDCIFLLLGGHFDLSSFQRSFFWIPEQGLHAFYVSVCAIGPLCYLSITWAGQVNQDEGKRAHGHSQAVMNLIA